jgi:hypothetical protein
MKLAHAGNVGKAEYNVYTSASYYAKAKDY